MQKAPSEKSMRQWLLDFQPRHHQLFRNGKLSLSDLDPKPWSGHFNFLVTISDQRFVLRFKGPEWGTPDGIKNEYAILKKVGKFNVGPKALHFIDDFFGEPAMFMEYLDGRLFTSLDSVAQRALFQDIAHFIARINQIPFHRKNFPFQESMESYKKNKKSWRERLKEIEQKKGLLSIGKEIRAVLPQLEKRLNSFEPLLEKIIEKHGAAFIFESAHAGHLLRIKGGLRFFNWEQVSFGDPSYTLAVFLSSMKASKDFEIIKKEMTTAYLEKMPIKDFEQLLEHRLWERAVSNALYRIWTTAHQQEEIINVFMLQKHVQEMISLDTS